MQADFRSAPGYNDSGEIIVPSRLATYVAPTMIGHYIRRHGYCPPVEFIAAVLDGPHPGSAEWFELAIDRGLYRRYVVECISFHQNLSRVPALLREQLRANYYSVCYSLKTDEALAEFFGLPFESQLELLGWRQRRWWEFWSDRPGRVVSSAS